MVDVAYGLPADYGTVYLWEQGKVCPSTPNLMRLAAFFDVPVTEFFDGKATAGAVT